MVKHYSDQWDLGNTDSLVWTIYLPVMPYAERLFLVESITVRVLDIKVLVQYAKFLQLIYANVEKDKERNFAMKSNIQ